MPKLPSVADFEARAPRVPAGVASYAVPDRQEAPGLALAQVGKNVQTLGLQFEEVLRHEQERLDTTRAEDASTKYKEAALELAVGDRGFTQKKAGDAVNGNIYQDFTTQLTQRRTDIAQGLQNPYTREKFKARADITDLQFKDHLLRHFNEQRGVYERAVAENTIRAAENLVAAAPTDQNVFNTAMVNVDARIMALARFEGINDKTPEGKAIISVMKDKAHDQLTAKRLDSLLYDQPLAAEALFKLVGDTIKNPELKLTLQHRIREAAMIVRATNDADALISEVRSGKPAPAAPGMAGQDLVKQNVAFLTGQLSEPGGDTPEVRVALAAERGKLTQPYEPNTTGMPNTRDVRAQLPILLGKVEARADAIYGTNRNDPDRTAYVAKLTTELKNKINLEVVQLESIQRQAQGDLIDFIAGFKGGAPVTGFSQIQQNPQMMRNWQLVDPAAKVGLERLMEHNLVQDQRGNTDTFWKLFARVHQEPGSTGKIDFYQDLLPFAGPNGLSVPQLHELKRQLDMSGTPGGRGLGQMQVYAAHIAEQYFMSNPILKATGGWVDAKLKWTDDVSKAIDRVYKEKGDPRTLFMIGTKDSMIDPSRLATYASMTPGQALSTEAAKVTIPPAQQPANITTREQLDAWFQTVPANVTTFRGSDNVVRKIPGRTAPAAAPAQVTPTGQPIPASTVLPQDKRPDGTTKGPGYFGTIPRRGGGESTELSVGVNIDGKETLIPLLVPTLTVGELDRLISGQPPTKAIMDKAVIHAEERIAAGKDPFAQPGDQVGLPNPPLKEPKVPELITERRKPRVGGGMTPEQVERRSAMTGALIERAKTTVTGAYGLATAPAALPRMAGEAIAQAIPTEPERLTAAFRQLVRQGTYTPASADIIRGAIETNALTESEMKVARTMLKNIDKAK